MPEKQDLEALSLKPLSALERGVTLELVGGLPLIVQRYEATLQAAEERIRELGGEVSELLAEIGVLRAYAGRSGFRGDPQ